MNRCLCDSSRDVFTSLADYLPYYDSLRLSSASAANQVSTDSGGNYVREIDVPGFDGESLSVEVVRKKDAVLSVSGKSGSREINRSFTVPDYIDPEAITAKVEKGVLTLTLPRKKESLPRKIVLS
jgi:HSP20 family protein